MQSTRKELSWMKVKPTRAVGVIGGMGPQATIDFLDRVVRATPVDREQDHLKIIVHNDPAIPNRHHSLAGQDSKAESHIVSIAKELERSGSDFLVMPSNTPHAYAPSIRNAVLIPLLDLIDLTCCEIESKVPADGTVGLLAAEGCLRARLYQSRLEAVGRKYCHLGSDDTCRLMEAVFAAKTNRANDLDRSTMAELAFKLVEKGAHTIVAACSEIPLLLDFEQLSVPSIDTTQLLAEATVEWATNKNSLSLRQNP